MIAIRKFKLVTVFDIFCFSFFFSGGFFELFSMLRNILRYLADF